MNISDSKLEESIPSHLPYLQCSSLLSRNASCFLKKFRLLLFILRYEVIPHCHLQGEFVFNHRCIRLSGLAICRNCTVYCKRIRKYPWIHLGRVIEELVKGSDVSLDHIGEVIDDILTIDHRQKETSWKKSIISLQCLSMCSRHGNQENRV